MVPSLLLGRGEAAGALDLPEGRGEVAGVELGVLLQRQPALLDGQNEGAPENDSSGQ